MERCSVVAFDLAHINELMLLVRDDVALIGRGVAWCRYESGKGTATTTTRRSASTTRTGATSCTLTRNWREVTWVAAASYLTRAEARKRFHKYTGDDYQEADYKVDRDGKEIGGADKRERAKFWEIWDKTTKRWCGSRRAARTSSTRTTRTLSCRIVFPCPKPAYGTVQPGSLIPVPEVLQYKDQLDEVNMLTGRIHALSEALEAKGFYPAGGGELAEAIETAIKIKTPGRRAGADQQLGGVRRLQGSHHLAADRHDRDHDHALVAMRKQVIDDIYQITGLSDIMRGATDARETLGAQQLKTQFGSTRIRDKQQELVRIARDLVGITAEIITEEFDAVTMIEMSQTQLPTAADDAAPGGRAQAADRHAAAGDAADAAADPAKSAGAAEDRQRPRHSAEAAAGAAGAADRPGRDQDDHGEADHRAGVDFFKNNRAKAFVLDIETDSTIMIDENGEKERRGEFIGVLSQLLPQIGADGHGEPAERGVLRRVAQVRGGAVPRRAQPRRRDRRADRADEAEGQAAGGDDPMTAQNKTAMEIEQMKIAHQKEKNQPRCR